MKQRQVRSFRANGKKFRFKTTPNLTDEGEKCWGLVHYEPHNTIQIERGARDEIRLDTIIHEFVHAYFDSGDERLFHEDTVTRFATEAARLLWRLGYRCPDDQQHGSGTE